MKMFLVPHFSAVVTSLRSFLPQELFYTPANEQGCDRHLFKNGAQIIAYENPFIRSCWWKRRQSWRWIWIPIMSAPSATRSHETKIGLVVWAEEAYSIFPSLPSWWRMQKSGHGSFDVGARRRVLDRLHVSQSVPHTAQKHAPWVDHERAYSHNQKKKKKKKERNPSKNGSVSPRDTRPPYLSPQIQSHTPKSASAWLMVTTEMISTLPEWIQNWSLRIYWNWSVRNMWRDRCVCISSNLLQYLLEEGIWLLRDREKRKRFLLLKDTATFWRTCGGPVPTNFHYLNLEAYQTVVKGYTGRLSVLSETAL